MPLKKKPTRYVANNLEGDWCGHWHRYFDRACQCARSWERYYRTKYNERQTWTVRQVNAVTGAENPPPTHAW